MKDRRRILYLRVGFGEPNAIEVATKPRYTVMRTAMSLPGPTLPSWGFFQGGSGGGRSVSYWMPRLQLLRPLQRRPHQIDGDGSG